MTADTFGQIACKGNPDVAIQEVSAWLCVGEALVRLVPPTAGRKIPVQEIVKTQRGIALHLKSSVVTIPDRRSVLKSWRNVIGAWWRGLTTEKSR